MFTPPSLTIALLMMITSAICWGSWANTYKGVKNYRFELFYWDYAIGIFLISLILAFTMGSSGRDSTSFVNNVKTAGTTNMASAMVGGAIFNLANLLLVAAIDMAGLAVAFPVSIGIALVVGVVLNYILQPQGNAMLLASGVADAIGLARQHSLELLGGNPRLILRRRAVGSEELVFAFALSDGQAIPRTDPFPVQIGHRLIDVARSLRAEIEVVGMLIHVECEDRGPSGEAVRVIRGPLVDQPAQALGPSEDRPA